MKNLLIAFLLILNTSSALLFAAEIKLSELKAKDLMTGQEIQMIDPGSKGYVIVFLSAKCPCSNSHNQEIIELSQIYQNFKFTVIHSNSDEDPSISIPYFQKASFPFSVVSDRDQKLADVFQAYKTPHSFVLSPDGQILYQGGVSDSKDCSQATRKYLREALVDLEAKRPIRTPEGRTLGCVIARGKNKF